MLSYVHSPGWDADTLLQGDKMQGKIGAPAPVPLGWGGGCGPQTPGHPGSAGNPKELRWEYGGMGGCDEPGEGYGLAQG